ncbi:MAG TPA: DUF1587 domain-containing protein, partial [Verrucomicrobiae bacterium]|nr:DUF1587 domain-containing protein [Verrucomicrobiae bacterium]
MTLRWYHRVARRSGAVAGLCCLCFIVAVARGRSVNAVADFKTTVQPILEEYCYDCHADGMSKGGIAFDELTNATQLLDHNLWMKVLKNTRAGIMPPRKKRRPAPAEQQKLENWVKFEAFGLDPKNPDPGRVTIRRLNRVEYRNTIRDLLGVDFRADVEFPPDDTGYGFDNIGDVLSVSPLLIEKYMEAAKEVVSAALPGVLGDVPARARRRESCLTARQLEPAKIPKSLDARRTRAREIVKKFATRAFRRPVDDETLDRLMTIAQRNLDGSTENFRRGVAQTMVAVLSSPRFLFRLEQPAAAPSKEYPYPEIDEFSLASRLSYFLWSTMP